MQPSETNIEILLSLSPNIPQNTAFRAGKVKVAKDTRQWSSFYTQN